MVDKPGVTKTNVIATTLSGTRSNDLLLLSTERAEKYDLLIHLLTNLQQTVVLVGPDGIGKTTFLEKLKTDKTEDWKICFVQGHAQLHFEYIERSVLGRLSEPTSQVPDLSLAKALTAYEKLNIKVVLLIDDAGMMMPGLITVLCQLAIAHPNLRIVFSLTTNQFERISKAETSINESYVIELPALSRWQCAQYLQNLSTNPVNQIDIKHVTLAFADKVYAETGGVPGVIISFLTDIPVFDKPATDKYVLFISCALFVGIVAYTMITGLPDIFIEEEKAAIDQTASLNDMVIEKTNQIDSSENELEAVVAGKNNTSQMQTKLTGDLTDINTTRKLSIAENQPVPNPGFQISSQLSDHQWILSQPDSNYTLQLIALSSLSKTIDLKNRHEHSGFPIILVKIHKQNGKRYVLLSGSFADIQAAKQASKKLPKPFQQPWIRKLGAVKKGLGK